MDLNLKPYLYRTFEVSYLIPVDLIEEFDELTARMVAPLLPDECDEERLPLYDTLDFYFDKYIVPDKVEQIVMWINPDDLA